MGRVLDLDGKVAVVTGAGSGIGRSTALLLARHGARVHAADIDADRAEEVAREIAAGGGSASAHALDVSDPAEHFKSQRQQRIAGKNRHRFTESFVTRRPSSAQIVIVQRRQIVMNQRVGVDQFECRRCLLDSF